ncbi:MAG: response regulator transcription factor [Dehalococcoidales bacterium]|nr:response regulator transcription factor [Dehalococcoidales bacterium]
MIEQKPAQKMTTLYIMVDNELYINLCIAVFKLKAPIEILGALSGRDVGILKQAVSRLHPDVVLLSVRDLKKVTIEEIEQIREEYPNLGLVLLIEVCNSQDNEQLRRLAMTKSKGGTAFFLKRRLVKIERLCTIVSAVSQGQLIIDTSLAPYLFAGKPGYSFLKKFSLMELELISLLANGYTNAAIAATLCIDVNVVEQQLNNIYSKLNLDNETADEYSRVNVAKLYLEATGNLHRKVEMSFHNPVNYI